MLPLQVHALLQRVDCLNQTDGNLCQRIAEHQASQSPSAWHCADSVETMVKSVSLASWLHSRQLLQQGRAASHFPCFGPS